jgi:hypothetical protein
VRRDLERTGHRTGRHAYYVHTWRHRDTGRTARVVAIRIGRDFDTVVFRYTDEAKARTERTYAFLWDFERLGLLDRKVNRAA